MINYVVGFAFSRDKKHVVLMEKQKPEWQKGKLNGVGGKIKESENPDDAMVREFKEEADVTFIDANWQQYALLKFPTANLFCYRIFSDDIFTCKTVEAEEVTVIKVKTALASKTIIPNLKILLPMAQDEEFEYAEIDAVVR